MSTSRPSWDVDWPPRQSNKGPEHERIGCPHEDQIPERQRGDDIQKAYEDVGFWPFPSDLKHETILETPPFGLYFNTTV